MQHPDDGSSRPRVDVGPLEAVALAATHAAALACCAWVGRHDQDAADGAATEAMRRALARAPGQGTVVIGEGEKDDAPMLFNGEVVGAGHGGPDFDIAVDPLEGTSFCAKGLPGALATIAIGEPGSFFSPGPGFYMDKIVAPPAARDVIDLADPPERILLRVGEALGKPVHELRVVIMDKPRHRGGTGLIDRVRAAGAAVHTPSGGDVAGALEVLLPTGGVDLLLGVGGTPEGVMTAAAVRALGGGMVGRLAPQTSDEATAVRQAGLSTDRVYRRDELVNGDALFAATGISGGSLLAAVRRAEGTTLAESLLITDGQIRHVRHTTVDPVPAR
ncbi:fructose-bisphosphatase class II family protein [Actinomycetospora sp. NBRC 106378]|uniref:fructose-bisphosphatase class II family protein n=1 Tax=Actinomycetospora sp. NBRC 106378 TaxID=3032208 RepID=UPI0024A48655|nr:fructose-bisphosphatase class II family protein [Actinomycetospora sp. NBRC 106378]GLZ56020.1 fructose-1,6-bisphosphatase [Actinomycetospora sp. NBRC 106378]